MFCSLPILLTVSALAQEPPAPAPGPGLVKQIEARYAAVDTLRMDFTQKVMSPLYGEVLQTGTVAFQRPGKMRWTFADEGKHYIGDGSAMWVYLERDKQAFKYGNWDASGSPESLLSSLDSLDALFAVTVDRSDATGHGLTLRPKTEAAYDHVKLELGPELKVTRVVLVDAMQTETILSFTKVELGPELPKDTFTFVPPAGVEVIEAGFPQ